MFRVQRLMFAGLTMTISMNHAVTLHAKRAHCLLIVPGPDCLNANRLDSPGTNWDIAPVLRIPATLAAGGISNHRVFPVSISVTIANNGRQSCHVSAWRVTMATVTWLHHFRFCRQRRMRCRVDIAHCRSTDIAVCFIDRPTCVLTRALEDFRFPRRSKRRAIAVSC